MSIVGSSTPPSPRRWGSVFDKLNDPTTFTGVYAERFRSGPAINASTDTIQHSPHRVSPEKTDTPVRDLQYITRDYLNKDHSAPSSPLQRAASRNRIRLDSATSQQYAAHDTTSQPQRPPLALEDVDEDATTVHTFEDDEDVLVPLDTNTQLQLIFQYYCRFGRTSAAGDEQDTIDSFNFVKLMKDSPGLLDRFVTITEIDLIFTKSKAKTSRRLTYGQFLDALSAIGAIKYHDAEDPTAAFSMLLANNIFQCPASLGIAAAIRSGALKVDTGKPRETYSPLKPVSRSISPKPYLQLPAAPLSPRSVAMMSSASRQGAEASTAAISALTPPADVYELISRKTAEVQMSTGTSPAQTPGRTTAAAKQTVGQPGFAFNQAFPEAPVSAGIQSRRAASPYRGVPQPQAAYMVDRSLIDVDGGISGQSSFRLGPGAVPVTATTIKSSRSPSPRRTDRSVVALMSPTGTVASLIAGGSYPRPRSTPLTRSPSVSNLGKPDYRPSIAGSGNKPGGVYDRLSSPHSFTGVYRRAWLTDGRINHFADTGVSSVPSQFDGHTNTKSDETIHDIKCLLRPNLRIGKFLK